MFNEDPFNTLLEVQDQKVLLPMFALFEYQISKADEWQKQHLTVCSDERHVLGWKFTENGIGVAMTRFCTCGEEIDVTDYENW